MQFGLAAPGFYTSHDIHTPLFFSEAGTGYSENVVINGLPAHRIGDKSDLHFLPIFPFPAHYEFIIEGMEGVLINGRPAAPSMAFTGPGGGRVLMGSHSVYANGTPTLFSVADLSQYGIDTTP